MPLQGPRPSARFRRPCFSLVELMMGTIILTLGLLIIGAVLPIAWRGSIDTAALTRADGAADAAKFHVENKCLVDGPRDLFNIASNYDPLVPAEGALNPAAPVPDDGDGASYSFLGDLDTYQLPDPNDPLKSVPTFYVHALHLENWAADGGSDFVGATRAVPEAPILIDRLTWEKLSAVPPTAPLVGVPYVLGLPTAVDPDQLVGEPVVRLPDRVFPPIPGAISLPPDGSETNPDYSPWAELLRSRKFSWAVFHRLIRPLGSNEPRYFIMYYVTLRRGESTNRYARENHSNFPLSSTSGPQARGFVDDVLFPVAWRVPMVIESSPPGVPALAYVGNAANFAAVPHVVQPDPGCNLAQMFPPGALFIDDVNGIVYKVVDREYVDADSEVARLTLDRDVRKSELEVQSPVDQFNTLDITNRMVWVFPPPVLEDAPRPMAGNPVAFSGFNPVVDIRVEPLTLLP